MGIIKLRRTFTGAWIETDFAEDLIDCSHVAPLQVRGLKRTPLQRSAKIMKSHLYRCVD